MYSRRKPLFTRGRRNAGQPHWFLVALSLGVLVAVTLLVLYLHRRPIYLRLRNAMFISGAAGLVVFATYPVAPPRLLDGGPFVDTVTTWSNSYRVLQPPSLVNKYAAVPSLHVGWNLLVGIKDALALIFLLMFFALLFGLLAGRPNAALPVSKGALLIPLFEQGQGRRMPHSVLLNVSDEMTVMQDEIFGPVLPIV